MNILLYIWIVIGLTAAIMSMTDNDLDIHIKIRKSDLSVAQKAIIYILIGPFYWLVLGSFLCIISIWKYLGTLGRPKEVNTNFLYQEEYKNSVLGKNPKPPL